MKSIPYYLILLLFFSVCVSAQTAREKKMNKIVDQYMRYPEVVEPSKEYLKATQLVSSALEKLKSGEVIEADQLINKSIETYPTRNVFEYIREVFLMPDINKANMLMDKLYQRVNSISEKEITIKDRVYSHTENGIKVKKIRNFEKNRALFHYVWDAYTLNKEFGNKSMIIKNIETALTLNISKLYLGVSRIDSNMLNPFDWEYDTQQQYFKPELEVLRGNYDKALKIVEEMQIDSIFSDSFKIPFLAKVYIAKGDYDTALKMTKDDYETKLKMTNYKFGAEGHEMLYNSSSFILNALLGNNEVALKALENYKKFSPYAQITNDMFYYLAIIDLSKKNYEGALSNLDLATNHKMEGLLSDTSGLYGINKWEFYKAMGDAYKGLKQYDKAKDFYNLSLLIDPDYQLAVSAMANLESLVATTISTDKNPPTIVITEPAVNRGLEIVSAGNDILVKGIAADPSGLKSVTINGIPVYAQKDGNFWGNIPLNKDLNKITVVATDEAGNTAEHLFEITKSDKEMPTDVIVATEKEGKSYCLLIGAQNYADSSIPSLDNPIQDAVRLKLILKKDYGFNDSNVITLFNPTANDVKGQLLELSAKIQPEDNLLIFYAGHGIWVEKEKKGYWLLTDAKRNDPNTWLQNKEVLDLIAKLPSRSTLLITDACFSGGVFKTRFIGKGAPEVIKSMNEKISRVAITSGNDTEVPDESIFMRYLVKALSENKEKYVTAQKMFINQIMEAVMKETKTEPRYGTLELAGHVGGDYVFMKK